MPGPGRPHDGPRQSGGRNVQGSDQTPFVTCAIVDTNTFWLVGSDLADSFMGIRSSNQTGSGRGRMKDIIGSILALRTEIQPYGWSPASGTITIIDPQVYEPGQKPLSLEGRNPFATDAADSFDGKYKSFESFFRSLDGNVNNKVRRLYDEFQRSGRDAAIRLLFSEFVHVCRITPSPGFKPNGLVHGVRVWTGYNDTFPASPSGMIGCLPALTIRHNLEIIEEHFRGVIPPTCAVLDSLDPLKVVAQFLGAAIPGIGTRVEGECDPSQSAMASRRAPVI